MKPRLRQTKVERQHGHCADLLMSDFGVDKRHRIAVCIEIGKIYAQCTCIHCVIIAGVRGAVRVPATAELRRRLEELQREG